MPKIHPTAVVDPSVQLASDVVVGPWCVVGPGVTIGEGTELVSHVVIDRDTTIGRENVLHPFSVIRDAVDERHRLHEAGEGERALDALADA